MLIHLIIWVYGQVLKKIESFDRIVCRLLVDDGNETPHDCSLVRQTEEFHFIIWVYGQVFRVSEGFGPDCLPADDSNRPREVCRSVRL